MAVETRTSIDSLTQRCYNIIRASHVSEDFDLSDVLLFNFSVQKKKNFIYFFFERLSGERVALF
jgi:hypothetical protein